MADRGLSRFVLLITSQWPSGGPNRQLDFLPHEDWAEGQALAGSERLPVDLYEQFLDPEAGACDPVPELKSVPDVRLYEPGSALVINPTLAVAKGALAHAFDQAKTHERVLVVHYIGHGLEDRPGEADQMGHRLLLMDSASVPSTDDEAWNPYLQAGQLIKSRQPPGFVFLVDACQAARARPEIGGWGTNPSTHVWMGASQNSAAFDGCFSKTLCTVMRNGDQRRSASRRPVPEIHSRHLRPLIDEQCFKPEERKLQQADDTTSRANDYVFITRNRAVEAYESDLGLLGPTRDRLRSTIGEDYQVIDVSTVQAGIKADPFVVVVGGAGSGKTALSAVLRDPPDELQIRRVDAVTFLEDRTTVDEIARTIQPQLAKHSHYDDLLRAHEHASTDLEIQSHHQRYVEGPLRRLEAFDNFIVCLDGLDQLAVENQEPILSAYRSLAEATEGRFRVLATSRPESAGGPIPDGCHVVDMPTLNLDLARRYLAGKGLDDEGQQDQVLALSEEPNWLVLALAAEQLLADPDLPLSKDTAQLYENIVTAAVDDLGAAAVRPVLDVLAASGEVAGVGPRLPLAIFTAAVGKLGGPTELAELNAVLGHERLYRIIERANPATPEEHLGYFHLTAIGALAPPEERRTAAHLAINAVLNELMASASADQDSDQ
jgi:hypothetical protein